MKKIFGVLLCIIILGNFSFASDISSSDVKTILAGMEIINLSDLNNKEVKREELAEILVKASKDAELGKATIRMSTFPDVPYTHEKASYIRLAALNGYLTAYSDGEFKPDNIVKNEEAITAMLKLLGYKSSDFTQSYPYEQLMIANGLDITDGVDTTIGVNITQEDLQRLIYNTLNCTVKGSNQKYVETLGYSVSGEITLGDVMSKNVGGPVTYTTNSTISSLTGLDNPTVYIDGKLSDKDSLAYYDVIYYSKNSNVIWAYTDKVTGMLENISPNKEAPTQISVSGKSYKLSTYSAKKAFSIDGIEVGKMVTLLLDRNKEVADVYLTEDLYSEQLGIIISTGKKSLMTTAGSERTSYYAEVLLTSGETMDIPTNSDYSKKVGYVAKISYKNGNVSIYSTKKSTDVYGKFDLDSGTLGKEKISKNVKILEVDDFGNVITVLPSRVNGIYFKSEQVALVSKNSNGIIENMIIRDVTGDTALYGILTDIDSDQLKDIETYTCIIEGNEKRYSDSDISFNVDVGPVQLYMDGQSIGELRNLEKVSGSIVNANNIYIENSKGEQLEVDANVVVYYKNNSNYYLYSMNEVLSGDYNISAYYDTIGEKVRVIIITL